MLEITNWKLLEITNNYKLQILYDPDPRQAPCHPAARSADGHPPPQRFHCCPGRSVHRIGSFLFSIPRHRSRLSTRWRRILSLSSSWNRHLHFLRNERAILSKRGAGSTTDRDAGSTDDDLHRPV